ncbi:MAG: D-arabinono-1,4-lactone oxidase [Actinomycetota bacterium]
MTLRNWAGNHAYRAAEIATPESTAALCAMLAGSPIKVIGTRHTFSDIGDGVRLVSLAGLRERFVVAADRRTVSIDGAMTYGRLCRLLEPEQLALANLASLPHISVAGAVATATHGSGVGNANLATAVRALTLATSDGPRRFAVGDPDWHGVVVAVGALGPVVELELAVEPAYDIAQTVYRGLRWDEVSADPLRFLGHAYSVSLFTRFGDTPGTLWVKRRVGHDHDAPPAGREVVAATEPLHPIDGHRPDACTEQLGVAGLWAHRLPHFRLGFEPSSGEEIQSEYFVPIDAAARAIDAVRGVAAEIAPALLVSEIRTVAGDDQWLSPQYEGATLALHFTWRPDPVAAAAAARTVERALEHLRPRPHWGKHFSPELDVRVPDRPRAAWLALRARLDPTGVYVNPWLERTLLA